jgi:acetyl esterase/lipase/rhodanese-related sulfurtransferase
MLPLALALTLALPDPAFTRTEDVIYGRKHGTALTLDVFAPAKPNGRGVLFMVSGGWFSAHAAINPGFYAPLLARGYTVFAVVHGSQPKYTIPEVLEDVHRAVRFVKANAAKYGVSPDKLGITGASAGGHLSLMQGTAGRPGDPDARDPVDRQPSGVAAVACFFPPTDFLNYGQPGNVALGQGPLTNFRPPFEFWERDKATNALTVLTNETRRREIGRQISPITHASAKSAPTLIAHGDADKLVPLQQAEVMVAKLKEAGVPAELVVKPGAAHGWANMAKDVERFADWFDTHLKPGEKPKPTHTADPLDVVKKAVAAGEAVLIDVREPEEWEAGHLAAAKSLPLSRLQDGVPAAELDRLLPAGKPVYLHCARGGRCLTVAGLPALAGRDLRPLKAGYAELVKAGFGKAP